MARPVGGISCGLVTEFDDAGNLKRHQTMVDIIGSEDHFGDMDFKLCGTTNGITGYQLDLKLPGIPLSILEEGVRKTRAALGQVLDAMNAAIAAPAAQLSPYAPKIAVTSIPPDRIGELIGPGGKNIKALQAETGTEVSIQDDGTVHIYSTSQAGLDAALRKVRNMFAEIEIGTIYEGRVVSTTNFGAFMEVLPGRDGLIHVSELADFRVNTVEEVVKVGDIVSAKCIGIDEKGRVKMSRKAFLRDKAKAAAGEGERESAAALTER
jgi:polyribonucleotide nucleotidyltransferase